LQQGVAVCRLVPSNWCKQQSLTYTTTNIILTSPQACTGAKSVCSSAHPSLSSRPTPLVPTFPDAISSPGEDGWLYTVGYSTLPKNQLLAPCRCRLQSLDPPHLSHFGWLMWEGAGMAVQEPPPLKVMRVSTSPRSGPPVGLLLPARRGLIWLAMNTPCWACWGGVGDVSTCVAGCVVTVCGVGRC
jgi:hypothetical protein